MSSLMKEINIPKQADGYVFTIVDIEENAKFNCSSKCYYVELHPDDCELKNKICQKITKSNSFSAIKLIINIKNLTNSDWIVEAGDIFLIDEDGFTYEGHILCEELLPFRTVKNRAKILPHTQSNYVQLFPNLPETATICTVRVNTGHSWIDFQISENANKVQLMEDVRVEDNNDGENSDNNSETRGLSPFPYIDHNRQWEINKFKERIAKLRTLIFSRLNNVLSTNEKTKLENKIKNEHFAISIELENKIEIEYKNLFEELNSIIDQYKYELNNQQELDYKRKTLSQKVDELLELSPREFEEYISELLKHLKYCDIELTPYSNDKGIDIFAYKDDIKYGIQCKRYKGTVGSPEIQKFLGALSHAKADKGLFITTGMFSFEAEKMASEHPIVLINRIDLAKMIFNAISNHD